MEATSVVEGSRHGNATREAALSTRCAPLHVVQSDTKSGKIRPEPAILQDFSLVRIIPKLLTRVDSLHPLQ
jgi:hypothetical protein